METDKFIKKYFKTVDTMNPAAIADFFTSDGTFRFGNNPAAVGKAAVEQGNVDFFALIGGLQHEIIGLTVGIWEKGEMVAVELAVTYTRKDGSQTDSLPCVSVIRMKEDKIQDLRIFADLAPLFGK